MTFNDEGILNFFKFDERAKIPNKRVEDGGFDIYPIYSKDIVEIEPNETVILHTGLGSVFSDRYVAVLQERGSTGTIGIAQRAGVIDSGYRGEWMIPITNTTNKMLFIISEDITEKELKRRMTYLYGDQYHHYFTYPQEKAICQALLLEVPKVVVNEITQEEAMNYSSERMIGCLGSSKK